MKNIVQKIEFDKKASLEERIEILKELIAEPILEIDETALKGTKRMEQRAVGGTDIPTQDAEWQVTITWQKIKE